MKTLSKVTSFILVFVLFTPMAFAGGLPLRVPQACRQIVHACETVNRSNKVTKFDPFVDCIDPITNDKVVKGVKPPPAKLVKACKNATTKKRNAIAHIKSK